MPVMQFDFDGLIRMLAESLYSEKKVFIRELIQNAHDAILRRQALDPSLAGHIDIDSRPQELILTVRDNGIGMNNSDLIEFLSTVGIGATRFEKEAIQGLIGQFGIGFLSAFVVASRVEVRTRKVGEDSGWLWENHGRAEYQIRPCEMKAPGTEVKVFLRGPEERGVIQPEEILEVIRKYADMLLVPIHLNGSSGPVNRRIMPWEDHSLSQEEKQLQSRIYLDQKMVDYVLEVIPVNLTEPVQANGVLYISKTRVFVVEVPRNVRIFQSRMFISENIPEILPKWATFVNGVINSTDLRPTAARDNLVRDEKFAQLREALGDRIIRYLEELQRDKPDRFADIVKFHDLRFKAACDYHPDLFDKFFNLLEWRTNGSESDEDGEPKPERLTMPQILDRIQRHATDGEVPTLRCFSARNATNQFFETYNAANLIVVDASFPFEDSLLRAYAKKNQRCLKLLHVDREDDPEVFARSAAADVRHLADKMSKGIQWVGGGTVRVEARSFQPADLAAVLRVGELSRAVSKAERLADDPDTSTDIREMAEALLRSYRSQSRKLTINASNPVIQKLAKQDLEDPLVRRIMVGIFNNTLLYSSDLLTPTNARLLHEDFEYFLRQTLDFFEREKLLGEREKAVLDQARREGDSNSPPLNHRAVFVSTGTNPSTVGEALRAVLEDHWGVEVFMSADLAKEHSRLDQLQPFFRRCDAFFTDMTQSDPGKLLQLGAFMTTRPAGQVIQMTNGSATKLPGTCEVNLAGLTDKTLTTHLETALRDIPALKAMIDDPTRERYIPPRRLREIIRQNFTDDPYPRLASQFPTRERWQAATLSTVEEILHSDDRDMASVIIQRIHRTYKGT